MKTSLLILTLWCSMLTAEKSILLRALRFPALNHQRTVRDVNGPSIPITTKPPCPSYITCPYPPYPRPTTKPPFTGENISTQSTSTSTDKLIVEYFGPESNSSSENIQTSSKIESKPDKITNVNEPGNANGPATSVTSKPPCPSYISCPYPPYPRPTTKNPQEESITSSTITSSTEKLIVEYFGPEKVDASPMTVSSSSTTDKPIRENKPGNANGPSISATSKPPCPSYITCPYPPYPRPTTKNSLQEGSVTTPTVHSTPEETIVEYFGPEKENVPELTPSTSDLSSTPDKPVRENKPGNANGPSISATSKPPCPGYITCPYPPYPRPTTKKPSSEESVPTSITDEALVEYIGPDKENVPELTSSSSDSSSTPDKPVRENKPGNANGPSISATSKPPCPGYITCPYPPYPRPTTKKPSVEGSGVTPSSITDEAIVEYFGPESSTLSEDPQNVSESELSPAAVTQRTESTATTQKINENSVAPSSLTDGESNLSNLPSTTTASHRSTTEKNNLENYSPGLETTNHPSTTDISGGWHFPGPSNVDRTTVQPFTTSTSKSHTMDITEYFGVSDNIQSNRITTRRPAISATQKPLCPFYASCPFEYPKPTTASSLLNKALSHTSSPTFNSVVSSDKEEIPNIPQTKLPSVPNIDGEETSQYPLSPDPVDLGNQGAYLPIYSYVYGFDPYVQNPYYYNRRPSILLTPRPFWPSYLKNPWIYPRPFGSQYAYEQDSSVGNDEEINSNGSEEAEERDQSNSDSDSELI